MSNQQSYISSELTHFVGKDDKTREEQYKRLIKILRECKLYHNLSGKISAYNSESGSISGVLVEIHPNAKISENDMYNPEMVCFCDIPKENLEIHIKKYSHFGLSFEKHFIVQRGGRPVYYIPIECPHRINLYRNMGKNISDVFDNIVKNINDSSNKNIINNIAVKPLSKTEESNIVNNCLFNSFLNLYILSYVKFFDHKLNDYDGQNYYFEREWRVLGNLKFKVSDIKSIYIPKSYKERFNKDFPQYSGDFVHPEEL